MRSTRRNAAAWSRTSRRCSRASSARSASPKSRPWWTGCSSRTGRSARPRRGNRNAPSKPRPGLPASTCIENPFWRGLPLTGRLVAGPKYPGFDTLALHAGQSPDPATGARAVPIYLTTSYVFRDAAHAASLFNMERAGHIYSRISNPTVAVLEERMAALEGGVGAIATASGQAALHLAVATLMDAGSHIVASNSLYGGSHNLRGYTLRRFGVETTFVSPRDPHNFARAIRPNTRLVFGETLGNPGLDVLDIPQVAQI